MNKKLPETMNDRQIDYYALAKRGWENSGWYELARQIDSGEFRRLAMGYFPLRTTQNDKSDKDAD